MKNRKNRNHNYHKKSKINEKKNIAYANMFCIISFFASLSYVLFDTVFTIASKKSSEHNNTLIVPIVAFALLVILLIVCYVMKKAIKNTIETQTHKKQKCVDKLEKTANIIDYLSIVFTAITLVLSIIVSSI